MKTLITITLKLSITLTLLLTPMIQSTACTIVSCIGPKGHVWNANNEDGPFDVANFINVFPATETTLGYYTLSYLSPRFGSGGMVQGGMNESGLTFDLNAINPASTFDLSDKKAFEQGDQAILTHILGTMSTTQEVVTFFETYWFQNNGLTQAQMHVADATGTFAIVSPTGIKITEKGQPLVSTNFDLNGGGDASTCWRYPVARDILSSENKGLETMTKVLEETAQKNGATMYSNIQNLTTGELWFFSKHDPDVQVHITLEQLLSKGQRSYTFSNLNALLETSSTTQPESFQKMSLTKEQLLEVSGTYSNSYIGDISVTPKENKIHLQFADGFAFDLEPANTHTFFIEEEGVTVFFDKNIQGEVEQLRFREKGFWSFTLPKKG